MKTYRVSIAATIPANFEATVKASTPEAAFNKAMEMYDNGEGEYQEIMDKPTLVQGEQEQGEHERHAPGVYVAEITKGFEEIQV